MSVPDHAHGIGVRKMCACAPPSLASQLCGVRCAVACPADCRGRGKCMPLRDIGSQYGVSTAPGVGGYGAGPSYANWEARVAFGCFCDWGYAGADCSQREWAAPRAAIRRAPSRSCVRVRAGLCPFGNPALTTNQESRAIVLTISKAGSNAISGDVVFTFAGQAAPHQTANADVLGVSCGTRGHSEARVCLGCAGRGIRRRAMRRVRRRGVPWRTSRRRRASFQVWTDRCASGGLAATCT